MTAARSRLHIGLLGLACLLHAEAVRADTAPASAPAALRAQLLASAQAWSNKGQTEIARQKIAKLLAIEPDSPEGLAFMGDLALRENKLDDARKILDRMQTWQPGHPATRELEQAYQIYSQQREKLTRMRLMVRAGRNQDAANLARELFPDGAPRYGSLGQEIARITGQRVRATTPNTPVAPVAPTAPAAVAKVPAQSATPRIASVTPTAPRRTEPATKSQLAGKAVARSGKPNEASPISEATPGATSVAAAPVPAGQAAVDAANVSATNPPTEPVPAPAPNAAAVIPVATTEPAAEAAQKRARSEALRAQADVALQAQRLSPALRLLEESLQLQPDDAWLRFDLSRLYIRLQQPQTARSVADEGVERMPTDTDMRYAHALLMESLDADEVALADLAQIPVDQVSDGMRALASRLDARQTAQAQTLAKANTSTNATRRQAWVEVGQIGLEKNATEGTTSLRGWERPVVAWLPLGSDSTVFMHVDQVQLDAGTLTKSPIPLPIGVSFIPPKFAMRADGFNVGIGYVGEDLRWDIGEIGVGFAVTNWVGGARKSGTIDTTDYSIELFRRPLTGTLSSYAGLYNPETQEAYGGVVATGLGARLAREIGPFNTSVSASAAALTGRNVADNNRFKWRIAADRDVYKTDQQVVNVGLALSGLYHEKDLSGFTLGQGNYYSPTRNFSLTLPVEWTGRKGLLTWQLKASASLSDSYSSASDYYPTNPAIQKDQGNPSYAASASSGSGWAVSGTAEYQVTPNLALGAQLEHEESDYYTPYSVLFYARYTFGKASQPLAQRPRPVQAYSQF